ncbi:Glycogenin-1 [Exaiptasia diaphana]|nr:Glycogenin-1 [Exaiptasia diaphana]
MENICEERGGSRRDYLWLTALVNDEYAIPAVVLGYSLQSLSCIKNMLVLVSHDVSQPARETLIKVGWQIMDVTAMDCKWMEKQLGQTPSGRGIKGTHTRFHAWKYTQYSKIVYVDPDFMPLSNIDELFEVKADFAAAYCNRPGTVDPCFNAGLIVFKPSLEDHKAIMDIWFSQSKQGTCPDDQRLLYSHYAFHGKWKQLPYAYNVRRIIHYPMKAFHFVCCPPDKPWKSKCRPSRDEARSFNRGIRNIRDMSLVYWKRFYFALKKYSIDEWYRKTKYYNAEMEFGKHLYKDCWQDFY